MEPARIVFTTIAAIGVLIGVVLNLYKHASYRPTAPPPAIQTVAAVSSSQPAPAPRAPAPIAAGRIGSAEPAKYPDGTRLAAEIGDETKTALAPLGRVYIVVPPNAATAWYVRPNSASAFHMAWYNWMDVDLKYQDPYTKQVKVVQYRRHPTAGQVSADPTQDAPGPHGYRLEAFRVVRSLETFPFEIEMTVQR